MPKEKANHVSIVANSNNNIMNMHVPIEHLISSPPCVDNMVINIQLLYDPNISIEPKLQNESFHPISLYRSIKYLVLDSKNIKNLLNFIVKYITNKKVDPAKSNDFKDFKGIGKAIWNLISFVYQSKWNSFIADKNSNTLRQKILLKLTLKVPLISNKSHKFLDKPIPVSIKKITSPIPTKLQKKINQISYYFKNIKPVNVSKLT